MYKALKIKKIFSIVFIALLFLMPVSPVFAQTTVYDFSDEAQAKFDSQINSVNSLNKISSSTSSPSK